VEYYYNHKTNCKAVAKKLGLSEVAVDSLIRQLFSESRLRKYAINGVEIRITNNGKFVPNRRMKDIMKRRPKVAQTIERWRFRNKKTKISSGLMNSSTVIIFVP
jgi:predicted transcriptional regulator